MTTIDLPDVEDRGEALEGHRRALDLLRKGTERDGEAVPVEGVVLPPAVAATEAVRVGLERANELVIGALADRTTRQYAADWRLFSAWCVEQGLSPLPCAVGTLAAFLGYHAGPHRQILRRRNGREEVVDNDTGLSPQRLEGYRAAIRWVHDLAGQPTPTGDRLISRLMRGAKRAWEKPKRKALAVTTYGASEDEQGLLQRLAAAIDISTPTGLRDRALLLTAFFSAMRRSELCAMKVGHIDKGHGDGWHIHIPRSKGDKKREGQDAAIPRRPGSDLCPVAALEAWLKQARRAGAVGKDVFVFRGIDRWGSISDAPLNPGSVSVILKRLAEKAGLNPEQVALVSGHSTRAGYASTAIIAGGTIPQVMQKLRHSDPKTLMSYMRRQNLLDDAVDEDALAGKRRRGKRAGGPQGGAPAD